jgi:surface polysaccharide O-acyltransferase-like enzyme
MEKNRLSYIDDIRSLVIFLVVMIHSSVTYSGLGGWYVTENKSESLGIVQLIVFGFFNSFNQAWFMGILFFFGGYFAAVNVARKGVGDFVKDRLRRLGIPLLGFMFVINPLMMYFIAYAKELRGTGTFAELYFGKYIASGMVWGETGPLWFAEALLLFCLAYALVAKFRRAPQTGVKPVSGSRPSVLALAALILVTAAAAFAIRLVFPIGTDVLNLQFCFFASYIVLFILGIRGASQGWFLSLTSGKNSRWLVAVGCVGIPVWAAIMIIGGALSGNISNINGGLRWQSAAYALWESFVAIGMSVGLTAAFANKRKEPGALSRFFSRNSFSVYVFHPIFLISLTKLLSSWTVTPLLKALLVGLAAFALSLAFAELVVRRVPFVKKYF